MGHIRVAYTISIKSDDGKELSVTKDHTLYEQNESNPERLQDILERDFTEREKMALQQELGAKIASLSIKVNHVTQLQSAGDDDQM